MKHHKSLYGIFMTTLAIVSIYFAIADVTNKINIQNNIYLLSIDISIWLVFVIDYFVKMYHSENKLNYILNNKLDALAMIPVPLLGIFYTNNIIAFLRVFRILSFIDEIRDNFKVFSKHRGLIYAIYILTIVITASSFAIYFLENGTTVKSIGDAFYWSITTASTCGYGDISPKTGLGKIVAVTLMMAGISVFGVIMGTIGQIITEKELTEVDDSDIIDLSKMSDTKKQLIKNLIKELNK